MPKQVVMDEFHLTFLVPRGLSASVYEAIHQTLVASRFKAELRRAVRQVIGRHPELSSVTVKVSC